MSEVRMRARSVPTPEPGPVPFRHRAQYAAFRLLRAVVSRIPTRVALGVGEGLGWLAGVVLRMRRDVVDENLARAFPERSSGWRRRVAVQSYRHLGREAVATFRMVGSSAEAVRSMTDCDGVDAIRSSLDEGRGVVVASAHLGNWEMGSVAVATRGIPIDAVVHRQRNRRFDDDLRETRGRLGVGIISRDVAPRRVLESLRRGRLVALVADQNVAGSGIFVDFFGVPASTARGPAVFALRTGAPLYVGVVVRSQKNPPRYKVVFRPIDVARSGELEEDVRRLTEAVTEAVEGFVREAPEQYFWVHRRWKTRPRAES
jgi:KDO2-lipid IV(A) lauroyltransferase